MFLLRLRKQVLYHELVILFFRYSHNLNFCLHFNVTYIKRMRFTTLDKILNVLSRSCKVCSRAVVCSMRYRFKYKAK